MAIFTTIFRSAYWTGAGVIALYALALTALTNPWLQRQYVLLHTIIAPRTDFM